MLRLTLRGPHAGRESPDDVYRFSLNKANKLYADITTWPTHRYTWIAATQCFAADDWSWGGTRPVRLRWCSNCSTELKNCYEGEKLQVRESTDHCCRFYDRKAW